ncbi:50S ribosomal protein L25/general stress protein Ctc [Bacillus sp. 1P06AnD]|uniref:50S ribosomal protein L25/general stress protein Ctc n=1 Tax=Bacillus sp. 1P06AnD TaxID=3132208 RepID=UPI00399F1F8C
MSQTLKAKERKELKHSNVTAIRGKGNIPAVVYGGKVDSTPIEVNELELIKTIQDNGRNGVIELDLEGKTQNVMLTDYQYDHLKNVFIHADFLAVNLSKKIDADISIVLEGEAKGVKEEGGVLQQVLHEISVSARPNDLPENVVVDISGLAIGDTITIGDIRKTISADVNNEDDEVIASVLAPRLEPETEDEEAEEAEV